MALASKIVECPATIVMPERTPVIKVDRRGCDHATGPRVVVEREDLVERSANLERARALQRLELEDQLAPAQVAQTGGRDRRRLHDVRSDDLGGAANARQGVGG